ncbi:hypothetical protein, partial [Nonomuraea sp. NPDC046570]|uniref:hypothetical protein n=1 Tax=Nonomuraea sp. NPDC046570 TaxID=3155255 RepID=UPI0033E795AA
MISFGGLAPALRLAERAGLDRLVGEHVALGAAEGVNAAPADNYIRPGHDQVGFRVACASSGRQERESACGMMI